MGAEVTSAASDRGHPAILVDCRDGIRNSGDPYDDADWRVPIQVKGILGSSTEAGRGASEASRAWTEPVIVLVKDAGPGQEPGLYMNSKVVAWDDLAGALKQELSGRREWAVYVEGDDCVAWAQVVNMIDIARSDGTKVFLLPQPDRKPCKTYVGRRPRENLIPTTDCGVKSYTQHFHRLGIYLSMYREPRPIPTCTR